MSLAIDGLVSGLDTTSLINSLMQVESVPQALLKNKISASQTLISSLQALNTKVAALADLATKTAKPVSFDLFSATSSSGTVTATALAGAAAGQLDIVVTRLAQTQASVSEAVTAWPDTSLTITRADGTSTAITSASTSLDDVVTAVNAAGAGVTATKVAVGAAGFRLQLTATVSGAAGAFTVSGTAAVMTEAKTGQDAEITLWAGSPAAQTITSATNTFTDLLPGVSVTVAAASVAPVSITIARDDARIATVAKDFVTSLTDVFSLIAAKSAVSTGIGATGASSTKAGVFTGDSSVRDVNQRILAAASLPVNGHSPSEYGIVITRTGTIEFNAEKFQAALAKDPAAVETALQTIAARVAVAASDASDKYDGAITSRITGQESLVRNLGNQVSDWDRRLESRRAGLERTYSALEVQLSALNSQSSWLSGQLASLPSA